MPKDGFFGLDGGPQSYSCLSRFQRKTWKLVGIGLKLDMMIFLNYIPGVLDTSVILDNLPYFQEAGDDVENLTVDPSGPGRQHTTGPPAKVRRKLESMLAFSCLNIPIFFGSNNTHVWEF